MLLLDEIEKAHPDLFNILLQIMDHGKLTDHNGKQVDFRNVILIMTTNAGAADLAKPAFGFMKIKREGDDNEAITRLFAPEFRNRLDSIISFGQLPQGGRLQGGRQVRRCSSRRSSPTATSPSSSPTRRATGWSRTATTRRWAQGRWPGSSSRTIKTPLADEVLFGKLKDGGAVRVIVVDKENGKKALGFEFPEGPITPKPEKDVAEAKKAREKRSAAAKKAAVTRKATIAKARKGKPGGGGGPSGPGGAGPKGGDPLGGNPVGGKSPAAKAPVRTVPKVPLVRS